MTERPILFSGPMVRAIRDDSKTQTRRMVKPQPIGHLWFWEGDNVDPEPQWFDGYERGRAPCGAGIEDINKPIRCPYGQPGDMLWVRETWDWRDWSWNKDCRVRIAYAADGEQADKTSPVGWRPTIYNYERWRPSIHMPRWASRITLEVLGVRVERVQDISEEDAKAEGMGWSSPQYLSRSDLDDQEDPRVVGYSPAGTSFARDNFQRLWCQINGPESWDANPWVWVVEFRRLP